MKMTWMIAAALATTLSHAARSAEADEAASAAASCGSEIGYIELEYAGTGYPSGTMINHKLKLSFQGDPLALDLYTDHGDNRTVRLDLEALTRTDEIYRAPLFHSHQIKPMGCIDDSSVHCNITDLRLEIEIATKSFVAPDDASQGARQKAALKCAGRTVNEFGKRVARELERRKSSILIK